MRILIIYASIHHGNTEKIARAIADEIGADIVKAWDVDVEKIKEYDVIGFGSGIYFFKHHKSILNLVDKLPETAKDAFIFSTKGGTPDFINHRALRKKLLSKGFRILSEFSCKGYDTYGILRLIGGINKGKPGVKEIEKAREFARKLKEMLS